MAQIRPFKAVRPQAQLAQSLASRPYDVLSSQEARVEARGNPNSFLHITKSEIDLPENTDTHSPEVYDRARINLEAFLNRDILFRENKPCYYIYRLVMNGRPQTGLVALSSVDDYDENIIKKHEHTRPEKEKDRIDHMLAIKAQTGNVFMAYRDVDGINELITKWTSQRAPVYDFVADDGIRHSLWIVNDDQAIAQITSAFASEVPATYIADGHHRAASAAKVRQAMGGETDSPAAWFLTTLFPASELRILEYNRVIRDLNGLDAAALLEKLGGAFGIEKSGSPVRPDSPRTFGMYLDHSWYLLKARETAGNEELDIELMQREILTPVFGITDQRTDPRIDFVGGIRGLAELENKVDSGGFAVAFSLYPVSIQQLFAVADAGEVMPPKSTWFEPKLRDGLVTHLLTE